jgi:hypothetical protein
VPIDEVVLQIETSQEVIESLREPDLDLLEPLMPKYADPDFPYLGYFDPYCQTIFNSYQMKPFLAEWRRLYERSPSARQEELLRAIEELAEKCHARAHSWLRFYGW